MINIGQIATQRARKLSDHFLQTTPTDEMISNSTVATWRSSILFLTSISYLSTFHAPVARFPTSFRLSHVQLFLIEIRFGLVDLHQPAVY